MSFVLDQVRRIDGQLDRLHWSKYANTPSSPIPSSASDNAPSDDDLLDDPPDAVRVAELQAAINQLSATSIRNRTLPLSSRTILSALRHAAMLDAHSSTQDEGSPRKMHPVEHDLEWLVVSKAIAQTHGLIIHFLLEQTLPLGWNIWYWDEVLSSSYYLGLYSVQTTPRRIWQWGNTVYHDARRKFQATGGMQGADQAGAVSISRSWSKFYGLVKDSIRDRSLADAQAKIMSPLMLYRSEARSKQKGLRRLREMSACGLGVLVDEGMNLDFDDSSPRRSKDEKDEWKTIVSRSLSLMETILRNLTILDLGIHEFEDTVFTSVEDDTELSQVNATDDESNQSLALMVNRLQLILQVHLPNHVASSKRMVKKYGRPSRVVRYWLPAAALLLSSSTLLRIAVNRKAQILTWFSDLGTTTMDFWYNWVVEPVRKLVGTIRHDKDSEIAIMSKESLEGDRASLERMVVDFARDNPSTSSGTPLNEVEIADVRAKVREGDLTPVLRAYEQDLRRPFLGTVRGDLIRALLIQIQKTKVDIEVAVGGIDALLKSQELVFGFVGLTPGVLVCLGLFRWLGSIVGGSRGRRAQRGNGHRIRLLRNIDRILSSSAPSNNGMLSYKDHGMLLCEVHVLRQSAGSVMPREIFAEFQEEIHDLVDLRTGVERQIRVVDRIRWAYSKWTR
ncbi:MAG: hypothetical protein LQ339_004617 [Xanthoria mediterranea]|nr:MAG: hypothetical protein LQ339_004617 [Xanthoria mediterranea]